MTMPYAACRLMSTAFGSPICERNVCRVVGLRKGRYVYCTFDGDANNLSDFAHVKIFCSETMVF